MKLGNFTSFSATDDMTGRSVRPKPRSGSSEFETLYNGDII